MQLKKLLRIYQQVLIMLAGTLVAIAGMLFGVVPLAGKVIALQAVVSSYGDDIASLRNKSAVLQSLDEATLRNELVDLSQAIPPDKSLGTVMSTLDVVSGNSGVSISSFDLQRPGSLATASAKKKSADETKLGASILPLSITIEGSFDQIRAFLSAVVGVRRYFGVSAFDITVNGANGSARLDMTAYYSPYPTTVGAVGSPIQSLTSAEQDTISKVSNLPLLSQAGFAATNNASASASFSGVRTDPFSF